MTHSPHGWLHDERSAPPIMALTCVPPVGFEPTALGLGIALDFCSWPVTCCFMGGDARISGMPETGGQQFAPHVAPRAAWHVHRRLETRSSDTGTSGSPKYPLSVAQ